MTHICNFGDLVASQLCLLGKLVGGLKSAWWGESMAPSQEILKPPPQTSTEKLEFSNLLWETQTWSLTGYIFLLVKRRSTLPAKCTMSWYLKICIFQTIVSIVLQLNICAGNGTRWKCFCLELSTTQFVQRKHHCYRLLLCIGHISNNGKVSFSYRCIVVRHLYTVKRHCCDWYNKKLHGQ